MVIKLRNLNIILFSMKRIIFNLRILFSEGQQYVTLTPEPTRSKKKVLFRQTLKGTYSENQLFLWPTTKVLGIEPRGVCMRGKHSPLSYIPDLTNDF